MTRVLVIDNYDSFVYNLVQYLGEFATDVLVQRNDAIDTATIRAIDPDAIVVSPGPGIPEDAGVSVPIFSDLEYPTLGVCLGHQALCAANGATVSHAPTVVHGKQSSIGHDGRGIFTDLPDSIQVGRYHSLSVTETNIPDCLESTAWTTDERDIVMAVRHRNRPHIGVQFHPESILTPTGKQMIRRFLNQ